MSEPYRPSNGTEGEIFCSEFCHRCVRDKDEDNPCPILTATLIHDIGEPEYPTEWIYDEGAENPRCTAFLLDAPTDEVERFYARRDPRQTSLLP